MDPIYAQSYTLTPAEKATIVVTLENRLHEVKRQYEDDLDVGDRLGAENCRALRDSLYSAIRAIEPERPCLPENRDYSYAAR
jgi:hypothetical protein